MPMLITQDTLISLIYLFSLYHTQNPLRKENNTDQFNLVIDSFKTFKN